MLLICLRDDIPLSLNAEQCKKMLLHICSKFNCPIEEAYNRFEYFNKLAYSHGEIINGGPERMYLDAKIKHNPRFNDIIIQLLPFIDEHYNGGNVSDIYWQKNMKITQIFNSKFDKRF